jgi:hypothetical protein
VVVILSPEAAVEVREEVVVEETERSTSNLTIRPRTFIVPGEAEEATIQDHFAVADKVM